jgi:hypothetical protein
VLAGSAETVVPLSIRPGTGSSVSLSLSLSLSLFLYGFAGSCGNARRQSSASLGLGLTINVLRSKTRQILHLSDTLRFAEFIGLHTMLALITETVVIVEIAIREVRTREDPTSTQSSALP